MSYNWTATYTPNTAEIGKVQRILSKYWAKKIENHKSKVKS